MWIEELKNGKYRAVERYTDPMTGKQKKISVTIEKDTRAARKEAQRILDQKIEKAIGDSGKPEALTLEKLVQLYNAAHQGIVKPATQQDNVTGLPKIARLIGNDVIASRLNAPFVMARIKEHVSKPETINYYLASIKKVYRWAYIQDLISDISWIDKLQPLKDDRRARIEDKYLEPEELQKLLDTLPNLKHRALTRFLALTGCRIGEALALNMADIDDSYIYITKNYLHGLQLLQDTPKTAASNREIYIQPELADFLKQYKKDRLKWQLAEGIRTDLLFFNQSGSFLGYSGYIAALKKASAAIGHEITPHALRHTHASLLAAAGISYDAIARRLGHAGDGITKEVYLHVTQKLKERDEAAMKEVRIL